MLASNDLVCRLGGYYFLYPDAQPVIMSLLAFNTCPAQLLLPGVRVAKRTESGRGWLSFLNFRHSSGKTLPNDNR